jgi:hypothetical protein
LKKKKKKKKERRGEERGEERRWGERITDNIQLAPKTNTSRQMRITIFTETRDRWIIRGEIVWRITRKR